MHVPSSEVERELRLAAAVKLYELGRLSSGKAAQLSGMDRVEFLLSLHRIGVAVLDLDPREIEDEIRYAEGNEPIVVNTGGRTGCA